MFFWIKTNKNDFLGGGQCLLLRAVASNTRGPSFESSHRQHLLSTYFLLTVEKTTIKKKEAENGPLF